MKSPRRFWLIAGACFAISAQGLPAQEERFFMFPKDKPVMEGTFPEGFKAAFRKDGTYLAVGPKSVMALVACDKKVKDGAAAKTALPEFAKSFLLRSLSFRDVSTPTVDDAKLDRMFDDKEAAVVAKMLTATGKNSDGDEMFVRATAFPWGHRYYVLFAVCNPADKEQLEKDSVSVLNSVSELNDD
jgi:hypothetical protein